MTAAGHPPTRGLRVLQSSQKPRATTNPYIVQLLRSLDDRVHLDTFSWRRALVGRYDVFHVHWPEVVFTRKSAGRTTALAGLFIVALVVMRLRGTAIVRTAHNLRPHEGASGVPAVALRLMDRVTTLWIRLNPETPVGGPAATILHGHYREWFAGYPEPSPVHGRLVFFGQVRAYKGVEEFLAAFARLDDQALTLRIAGSPNPGGYAEGIERLAATDPRVSLHLSFVDDADLAREIGEAELVVLPYQEMHNSGALLLALSLDRPVLVPENPVTDALAAEVRGDWVLRYSGALTASTLEQALADRRRTSPAERPYLGDREWDAVADAHVEAYREAVALRRGRPRHRR